MKPIAPYTFVAALLLVLPGCEREQQAAAPPPPEVGVVRAEPRSVPLTRDLVGRLSPVRSADVRARVAGIVQKRLYTEGSLVKEGQPLFQIDPAPLRAALNAANAALAQAEAAATNAHIVAERGRAVAAQGLISRAELDAAEANERSTAAAVKQARANVEAARINLGYATVRAPISGRAGQQRVTEGALVGENEATLLTTVEQLDPIYVNFDQPADEVARLRRAQADGRVSLTEQDKATVHITLPDGSPYELAGTLDFLDFSVNPATSALAFRAVVPNPDRQLLPGMFVNVRLTVGQQHDAFLVPTNALKRDSNGAFVYVIGADGKVAQKRVRAESLFNDSWVVTEGISEGDQIVVSGAGRLRPGMAAKAVPVETRTTQRTAEHAVPAGAGGSGAVQGD